jgi:flagellar export protein FliJ
MAATLVFRFEAILRLRKQREDEKKRAVAARLRRIADVRQRQDNLRNAIDLHSDALRDALREQAMDVDQLRWGRHWLTHLRRGVLEAESELSANRAMLAQERNLLVEARKQTQAFARLKERRRQDFLVEAARRERIEADELTTARFAYAMESEERS